jgi:hypothetical protein
MQVQLLMVPRMLPIRHFLLLPLQKHPKLSDCLRLLLEQPRQEVVGAVLVRPSAEAVAEEGSIISL